MSLRSKALVEIAIKAETADGPLADALRALVADATAISEQGGPYVFGADAAPQTLGVQPVWLRDGSALLTSPTVIGVVISRAQNLSKLAVSHVGDTGNGTSVVSYDLYRNNAIVPGAFASLAANSATVLGSLTTFAPIALVPGDVIEVRVSATPQLTNGVTEIRFTVAD